jgi:hypothetical protein
MSMLDPIVESYGQDKLQVAFSRAVVDCGGLADAEVVVQTYCDHLRMMALGEVMAAA